MIYNKTCHSILHLIGQFVARFVGGLRVWQLALAMVALPATVPVDQNYFSQVRSTGSLTQQGYDIDSSTPLAGNGGGKAGPIAIAGAVDVSSQTVDLTDAQYWDGSRMSEWTSCSGASAAGG